MKRAINSNIQGWWELTGRCTRNSTHKLTLTVTKHRYPDKSTHYIATMGTSGSYDIEESLAKKLISICEEIQI